MAGEHLGSVGGAWDRRDRCYVGDAARPVVFVVHPGQEAAMRWFMRWLESYLLWRRGAGKRLATATDEAIRSMLLLAGRRAGKTDFAIRALILFCLAVPFSRTWVVAAALTEIEELEKNLHEMIPPALLRGKPLGAPWFRWSLVNGSTIAIRSAHDPESLKRGRCDCAVLNEGQKMGERAYANVRGALADRGGLCIVAANPPDDASGQWVVDMQEEAMAGRRPTVCFSWSARENPKIDWSSLEAMKSEFDDRTYRQEILGEIVPRSDIVWTAFRQANVQEPGVLILGPDGGPAAIGTPHSTSVVLEDVTAAFVRKHFHRDGDTILGLDFQLRPYMAATVRRIYRAYWPDAEPTDLLDWTTAEAAVDHGDEVDLSDALKVMGIDPRASVCVGDASGEWQNAERTKGGGSFDMLRQQGWYIVTPDTMSTKNPGILDSVRASNSRLCAADGHRRAFVAPGCLNVVRALKMYENKFGVPNRRSAFAHFSDAWRYVHWRFWPRRLEKPRRALQLDVVNIHGGQGDHGRTGW